MHRIKERFSETEKPARNLNLPCDYCDKSQLNCFERVLFHFLISGQMGCGSKGKKNDEIE